MGPFKVAIIGATGAVGEKIRELLKERQFPVKELVLFASEKSVGKIVDGIPVKKLSEENIDEDFDFVFFSAGSQVSKKWAPLFAEKNAYVIDNSSAWRADPQIPLIIPEINFSAIKEKGIIANPNCVAITILMALKPLHDHLQLQSFVATSFQAAGGAGEKGMEELENQVPYMHENRQRLRGKAGDLWDNLSQPKVHKKPLAYNVVPFLGEEASGGYTDEELKMIYESRKILQLPSLKVNPTCVRVPVLVGHAVEIHVTFAKEVDLQEVKEKLDNFPGVALDNCPTPVEQAGEDSVAVGRVRSDLNDPRSLNLFVVADNLLKGAALNAIQIAEKLIK